VIDFWATWCKPCVNSIPKLVELYDSYDKEEVAFIGISIDSPRNLAKVKPFMQSMGVNYPVLLDMNQEVMRDMNLTSVPALLIVNADDEIVSFHEGFAPGDEDKIKKEIDAFVYE
jgi:thiol-disulfide isomerase/thioredoxin